MTTTLTESGPLPGDNRALIAVAAMFFNNGAVYASWAPRIPELRTQVDISTATLGLLLGVAGLLGLVGSVLSGFTVDRFGSRWITVFSGLTLSTMLAVAGFTSSALVLGTALAVLSLTDVLTDVGMNVQGAQISARRDTPVMNRLHGVWSLGTVLGALLSFRITAAGVSLRTHLSIVSAIMVLNVCIAGFGLLRTDNPLVEEMGEKRPLGSARKLQLAILTALGFLAISVEIIPSDWSAVRLTDDLGAAPDTASLGFLAFVSGMFSGRMVGDFVVHRFGSQRVLTGAAGLSASGLAIATLAPNVALSLIGFLIAGLGGSVMFPQIYARAAETPGVNPGRGLAFMTAGQRFATFSVPLVVGFLANQSAISVGQAVALLAVPAAVALFALSLRSPSADTQSR